MNVLNQVSTDRYTLVHGDACEAVKSLPDASVDLTVHSPPFANLYIYSDSEADMGNCATDEEFFNHYRFLIPELYRATVPGRNCVVHCKDLPRYANRDGTAGLIDFPGRIIQAFEECGWSFHSRVTIWKCPVVERERTNNNGLLHKTILRDRSQVRQGMADYLLVFRKAPIGTLMSEKPVENGEAGLDRYHGQMDPRTSSFHPSQFARTSRPSNESIALWQRYAEPVWWDASHASPEDYAAMQILLSAGWDADRVRSLFGLSESDAVWFDVNQTNVLNQEAGRESQDEKHICPLQLDLIARCISLWSQPGDVVLDPFSGLGSTGHEAVKLDRKYVGFELKESYWKASQRFLNAAVQSTRQMSLFS